MSTSLLSPLANLSEIYKKECKKCKGRRKLKSADNFNGVKINKLKYNYKECKKKWLKPINGLIKKFPNIHQFQNGDVNKLLRY